MSSRNIYRGYFIRNGSKKSFKGYVKAILIQQIKDESDILVSEKQWFSYLKTFQALGPLKEGDIIEFKASCEEKEFNGRIINYLSRPSEAIIVNKHSNHSSNSSKKNRYDNRVYAILEGIDQNFK